MDTKLTNFPEGLSSFGIPLVGSGSVPITNGTYWFVSQAIGNDGAVGTNMEQPLASIGAAIARAVSGDVILVASTPNSYNENLHVTTNFLTIIGYAPSGFGRPDVTSATGAALIVHAQGFVASHIRFVGTLVGGIGVQQSGNGFLYTDCVFESTSNIGFRFFPDSADDRFTASEGKVLDCLIRDCAGGGMSFENPGPVAGVGCTDNVVAGCRFYGNTGHDIFDVYTAGGNNQTFSRSVIEQCQFASHNATNYINLSAGTANDGLISENYFAFTTAGGLTTTQITLGNNIAFSGNCDAVGVVDGHTF